MRLTAARECAFGVAVANMFLLASPAIQPVFCRDLFLRLGRRLAIPSLGSCLSGLNIDASSFAECSSRAQFSATREGASNFWQSVQVAGSWSLHSTPRRVLAHEAARESCISPLVDR